jgi:hypothetical protein
MSPLLRGLVAGDLDNSLVVTAKNPDGGGPLQEQHVVLLGNAVHGAADLARRRHHKRRAGEGVAIHDVGCRHRKTRGFDDLEEDEDFDYSYNSNFHRSLHEMKHLYDDVKDCDTCE